MVQELFMASMTGPGVPDVQDGNFLWLSKPIFLIIPNWLLEVLSFGLLSPKKVLSLLAVLCFTSKKSTNTDACWRFSPSGFCQPKIHFSQSTCFTSTKVQVLTPATRCLLLSPKKVNNKSKLILCMCHHTIYVLSCYDICVLILYIGQQ